MRYKMTRKTANSSSPDLLFFKLKMRQNPFSAIRLPLGELTTLPQTALSTTERNTLPVLLPSTPPNSASRTRRLRTAPQFSGPSTQMPGYVSVNRPLVCAHTLTLNLTMLLTARRSRPCGVCCSYSPCARPTQGG